MDIVEVHYRCIVNSCATLFSDPEKAKTFSDWNKMVDEHLRNKHKIDLAWRLDGKYSINDFLEPAYLGG